MNYGAGGDARPSPQANAAFDTRKTSNAETRAPRMAALNTVRNPSAGGTSSWVTKSASYRPNDRGVGNGGIVEVCGDESGELQAEEESRPCQFAPAD